MRTVQWARLFSQSAGTPVPESPAELETQLARVEGVARAAWPNLQVPAEDFIRHLGAAMRGAADPLQRLAKVHAADLFLACACARGEAPALNELERGWLAPLGPALARLEGSGLQPEDALQLLREKLWVAQKGRPPKIAEYAGQGPLKAWLKTAALRTAISAGRSQREEATDTADLIAMATPGRDAELDYIHARYRDAFRQAFQAALATLSKRQRSLLRFQVIEGLNIDQIGGIYHANRATAARWLAEARELLLMQTRRQLAAQLGLEQTELDSMMDLLATRIDLSITGFLRRR